MKLIVNKHTEVYFTECDGCLGCNYLLTVKQNSANNELCNTK